MFGTKANIGLGQYFGVPVGLHWSWFLIFALVTGSLSAGYYPELLPQHTWQTYWTLGTVTSLLFFLSVLAHEFGHAWIALRRGLPVHSITLMIFGGVAQIGQEPRSAGDEFQIAIAGPLASLAAGIGFGMLWLAFRPIPMLAYPAEWLARINLALVAFNMIPGFPLDGGRVARAILWSLTRNRQRATRFMGYGSQAIAFGFIGVGVFSAFGGNFINAIWLVFVGWFLENTATAYREQTLIDSAVGHVRVGHVMNREFREIPADTRLTDLRAPVNASEPIPLYFLYDGNRLCGMLSSADLSRLANAGPIPVTARQAMTPIGQDTSLQPEIPLLTAINSMDRAGLSAMPVIQNGLLTGYLAREQIANYIRARREP
jgi:Zn-dependent protease